MAKYVQRGFTIIEVMLFLAIGTALTIAILATAGVGIAAQRYKDAVATLQSDLQQQYEDVLSVRNSRTASIDDDQCGGDSGTRGTSINCAILGRLMTLSSNGTILRYVIYGSASATDTSDEYALLRSYNPRVLLDTAQESKVEWNVKIAAPGVGGGSSNVTILILRSPESGSVYTFTRGGVNANNLSSMIYSSYASQRTICVNPNGLPVGDTLAVVVVKNASSASGVEVRSNQAMEGVKC